MIVAIIRRYFLRMYAAELRDQHKKPQSGYFGPFGEALYQTMLFVLILLLGIVSTEVLPLLMIKNPLKEFLWANRFAVTVGLGMTLCVLAFLIAKSVAGKFKDSPEAAIAFDSQRDRVISNVQFWLAFLFGLGTPFLMAALIVHWPD
jgi:hypothetical protein